MNTEEVKALWRKLPLAEENDFSKLDEQIELQPKLWACVGRFLQDTELALLPLGRNEIGEGAFCNVQEYETRLQSKYELHRCYIDIQLLTQGEELVWAAPLAQCHGQQGEFNVEADFVLYEEAESPRAVKVTSERWLVLYPSDAHMPCMAIDATPQTVRKMVVKVPYARE